MYYYAYINTDNGFCYDVMESEEQMNDPSYIEVSGFLTYAEYCRYYPTRKTYENGAWRDTTVEEAERMYSTIIGERAAIGGEWLSIILDNKANIEHTHEDYAVSNHVHTEYASSDDLQVLTDIMDTKADSNHTHSEYANVNHSHDGYATQVAVDELGEEVNGKANVVHSHSEYALSSHEHDYAEIGHNHDSTYAPLTHSHADYITVTNFDTLESVVEGKANTSTLNSHTSNTEIHITDAEREVWNAKSDFSGNYNDLINKPSIPSVNGLASEDYVDEKVGAVTVESIGALPNTTVIPTVPTNVSAFTNDAGYLTEHQSLNGLATETYVNTQIDAIDIPATLSDLTTDSTHRVVTDAEKTAWNAKSNFSGSYNDLTDKPSIPSVSGLATETYVDEAVSTKANSSHTHTIANVSGLQSALNAKSDITHNHTGVYDVNGAAASALSSANTYTDEAIDTLSETVATKANASALTSHTGNATIHVTEANKTNWNAAKTHADSAHAPTTNATQAASGLMSKTDKIKLDGIADGANNYTLPSAGTNLGGVKSGGDVQISGGVITVNDDSHNHVISNIDGLQGILDGKSASGHNHDGVYYTETEVDTLLEGKANTSHTHTIANITNLQSTLDGKAATSHGTHVSYSTTSPVMDGSASVGTASTVARSDHKHPTDTSRAAKTELDELATTVSGKANSSHTHTIANVTNLQTQLDGKAASSHTHSYAGSSSVGGSATSAVKLDTTTAGDANTPVYFTGGKPVACTSLDLNTSGSSASCTGNSATATKLQIARTIALGTGATGTATSFDGTGNITIPVTDVKESYLSWGGKNLSGSVSPLDAACSNVHSANRFAFAKAAGITIEYSTNGSTYSTYSTTDSAKVNLVSGIGSGYYIGARSTSTTVNDKLRITLNATNMGLYTRLQKLLINISTNYATGSNVIVEKSMKGSESTYITVGTYAISGWSGWNSIPISAAFGGGDTQTYNIANIRLTFGITGVNSSQSANALTITDIIGIGDTYWSHPSTMAKTGHLYSYDSSQNATFPANVTATTVNGTTFSGSGVATLAEVQSYLGI